MNAIKQYVELGNEKSVNELMKYKDAIIKAVIYVNSDNFNEISGKLKNYESVGIEGGFKIMVKREGNQAMQQIFLVNYDNVFGFKEHLFGANVIVSDLDDLEGLTSKTYIEAQKPVVQLA